MDALDPKAFREAAQETLQKGWDPRRWTERTRRLALGFLLSAALWPLLLAAAQGGDLGALRDGPVYGLPGPGVHLTRRDRFVEEEIKTSWVRSSFDGL